MGASPQTPGLAALEEYYSVTVENRGGIIVFTVEEVEKGILSTTFLSGNTAINFERSAAGVKEVGRVGVRFLTRGREDYPVTRAAWRRHSWLDHFNHVVSPELWRLKKFQMQTFA